MSLFTFSLLQNVQKFQTFNLPFTIRELLSAEISTSFVRVLIWSSSNVWTFYMIKLIMKIRNISTKIKWLWLLPKAFFLSYYKVCGTECVEHAISKMYFVYYPFLHAGLSGPILSRKKSNKFCLHLKGSGAVARVVWSR